MDDAPASEQPASTEARPATGEPLVIGAPEAVETSEEPVILSWSGGKDSSLALWALRAAGVNVAGLLTTVTSEYNRISMHGVRQSLLEQQAQAVGLPLHQVSIPPDCPNTLYQQRMREALESPELAQIQTYAFADLFLADIRRYREEQLQAAGKRAIFPLWQLDTGRLARRFVAAGFRAYLVCVDPRQLDRSFAGRAFDETLLDDLPEGADPCGENGEFHTFVWDGPIFNQPVRCQRGEVVERDDFVFCELLAKN